MTGANAGDFAQTNTCPIAPRTLAVGRQLHDLGHLHAERARQPKRRRLRHRRRGGQPADGRAQRDRHGARGDAHPDQPRLRHPARSARRAPRRASTLRNSGTAPLTISSIGLTGANAGDFAQTQRLPAQPDHARRRRQLHDLRHLQPDRGRQRGRPASAIADDAAGSPQSVALSGTGVAAGAGGHALADQPRFRQPARRDGERRPARDADQLRQRPR